MDGYKDWIALTKNRIKNSPVLYVRLKKLIPPFKFKGSSITSISSAEHILDEIRTLKSLNNTYFLILIFVGIAFGIGLLALIAFFYNKKPEFLYYALYLVCLILYLIRFPLFENSPRINIDSFLSFTVSNSLEILSNIFYTLFVKTFLNLKSKLQIANRLANGIIIVLAGLFLFEIVLYAINNPEFHRISLSIRIFGLTSVFLIISVLIVIKLNNPLVYIVLSGSTALAVGSVLFGVYDEKNYLVLGVIIEILIFGLGILYKIKLLNAERDRVRAEAIESKNRELRAQINPHFIFNALSSIQNLVTENNKEASLNYLSKFGRLTRNILESSISTHVLLADEIKMLKDYLELESLRFNDSFNFSIGVAEDIDPHEIEIPMLIVQPFAENAIIHGLLPKEKGEGADVAYSIFKKGKSAHMHSRGQWYR